MRITRNLVTTKKIGATALIAALAVGGMLTSGAQMAQAAEVSASAIGVDAPLASVVRPSGLNPADVTPKANAHEGALALNEVAWRGYFTIGAALYDGANPATGWCDSLPHREILYEPDSEASHGGPHDDSSVFVFNMTEVDGIAGTAGEGYTYLDARGAWITHEYMQELGLSAVPATEVDPTLVEGSGTAEGELGETGLVATVPSEAIPTEPTESTEPAPSESAPAATEPASGDTTAPQAAVPEEPTTPDASSGESTNDDSNADGESNLAQTGAEGLM